MSVRESIIKAEKYLDKYKRQTKEKLGLFETAIIYPYRGYGNDKKALLKGRVLEQEKAIHSSERENREGLMYNALRFLKRYESDEIPGITIQGEFAGQIQSTTSGDDGYFELIFHYDKRPTPGWNEVPLKVVEKEMDIPIKMEATGEIFIPEVSANYGIISDVDDTLIESNATNLIERIKTMVTHNAHSRPVFDGVEHLYQALSNNFQNFI